MFGRIGPMELILIFSIALIIFGPKKLPEIGKAIGSAIRNFKRQSESVAEEFESEGAIASKSSGSAKAASSAEAPGKPDTQPEVKTNGE